nr:reverse transcriptase domain-containing protein [Bacillus sp. FJAT-42376]
MRTELLANEDKIKRNFQNLNTFNDIANLLEIPVEFLWKILIRDRAHSYRRFELRKKNGDPRIIYSPNTNLSILQKKFLYVLELNFNSHQRAHGFVKNRDIITNANEHINKRFVLNFDLENFFESINFRRVRHMFISYFKLNETVASTLANLCCHPDGFLPQGAATSPIISNILSKSMDKELTRIAINVRGCNYTRYADDITFSSNKRIFPTQIAIQHSDGNIEISEEVIKIINKYGFSIKESKTRMSDWKQHQSVTGIVVNSKLNVSRKYVRKVRSILHSAEKNIDNLDVAVELFNSKYNFRQKNNNTYPDMFSILRGKIAHIGNVKGKIDPVFLNLAKRYNQIAHLNEEPLIIIPPNDIQFYQENTFVMECNEFELYIDKNDETGEFIYGQGSGFLLKGIGLITNAHVVKEVIDLMKNEVKFINKYYVAIHRASPYDIIYKARIICYSIEKDLAILEVENLDIESIGYSANESIKKDMQINLVGFPSYREGNDIKSQSGYVEGIRMHEKINVRYEISATIYEGNSGGPVFNASNEVIGVATKGTTSNGVSPNEIIPISEVLKLAKEV